MAATTIIMAILGCGDAGAACQPIAVAPARYETVAACVAAQDEVLASTDVLYPVVTAQCRPANGAEPARLDKPKAEPAAKRPAMRMASRG